MCQRPTHSHNRLDVFLIMRSGFFTTPLSGVHAAEFMVLSLSAFEPTIALVSALIGITTTKVTDKMEGQGHYEQM